MISIRKQIEQEEYCFDIAYDDEGASLLINSNEQMLSEKLWSLLKFGTFPQDLRIYTNYVSLCNTVLSR
jgi:hypothetical protein